MVMGSEEGTFKYRVNTVIGPSPVQLEKADFDRDGDMDLAVLSVGSAGPAGAEYAQSLYVLQNDGNGRFPSPFVVATSTGDPAPRFTVGDADADGWPDLWLLEPSVSRVVLLRNIANEKALSFQGAPQLDVDPDTVCLGAGDFDGDGDDDLVVASGREERGRVRLLLSDGAGGGVEGPASEIEVRPLCLAVARLDGDPWPDIAIGGSGTDGDRACVVPGGGPGSLAAPLESILRGQPAALSLGDLNGSGMLDLAFALPAEAILGSVLVSQDAPLAGIFIRGDANGDGILDISDAVATLGFLFLGRTVDCLEALDADDDLEVNLTDAIRVLNHLFLGGPQPAPPFPEPGEDPEEETLGCERRPAA